MYYTPKNFEVSNYLALIDLGTHFATSLVLWPLRLTMAFLKLLVHRQATSEYMLSDVQANINWTEPKIVHFNMSSK